MPYADWWKAVHPQEKVMKALSCFQHCGKDSPVGLGEQAKLLQNAHIRHTTTPSEPFSQLSCRLDGILKVGASKCFSQGMCMLK